MKNSQTTATKTDMARAIVNQLYRLPESNNVWSRVAKRTFAGIMRKPKSHIITMHNLAVAAREADAQAVEQQIALLEFTLKG